MTQHITISAHTTEVLAEIRNMRYSPSKDGCTTIAMRTSPFPELYRIEPNIKPRTVQVLVTHSREVLADFGMPLDNCFVEVDQTDGHYQVNFVNKKGAVLSVVGIILTDNRCGIVCNHGVAADVRSEFCMREYAHLTN